MIRIGIVGTESTHALRIAKYFNLRDKATGKVPYEGISVTAVWGNEEENERLKKEAAVNFAVTHPEDLLGKVDAVMITARRGSTHYGLAEPFIHAGLPLFIDKPFTSCTADAEKLMAAVREHGCKIMGGSSFRFALPIQQIKELVNDLRAKGEFMGASFGYRVLLDSEYDGFYFYAPHLVEMSIAAFGADFKTLSASRTESSILCCLQYEHDTVSLHFGSRTMVPGCTVYGKYGNAYFDVQYQQSLELQASRFARMLQDDLPSDSDAELVFPVRVMDAIVQSISEQRTIYF